MSHEDFASTASTAALESACKPRLPYRHGVVLFLSALAYLVFPALLGGAVWGYYVYDQTRPVVTDFKIQTQFPTPVGVLIDGTMNKVRDCEVVEVSARTVQREVKSVEFMDLRSDSTPAFSRPLGPQKWGPWRIWAKEGEGITLFVRHRCNAFWTHSEELSSFVVGKQ